MATNTHYPEDQIVAVVAQVHDLDFEEARVLVQHVRAQYPRASKRFTATPHPLSQAELRWLDARLLAMAAEDA